MAADPTSNLEEALQEVVTGLGEIIQELQLLRAAVELQQPGVDAFDLVGNEYDGRLPG